MPGDNLLRPNTGASSADSVATRNESSTPRSTILPSSPALTKKLKPLRGNSEKFRTIVAEAKVALLVKGFDVGTLDGQLDARAMAAIFKFQKSIGLPPDGKLTADVLSALNIRAT